MRITYYDLTTDKPNLLTRIMTPKTLELSDIFESAWETISAALPPLLLAKKKVEGVTTSSMRYMFEGPLGVWDVQGELEDFLAAIKPR